MDKEYWLKCSEMVPGMHKNLEKYIMFYNFKNEYQHGFIWNPQVNEEEKLVRVDIYGKRGDTVLVGNDSWSMFGSSRVWVSKNQIVAKQAPE